MCGCGRTSRPLPGSKTAGPRWSKKMNGPTSLCGWLGSRRLTVNPPTSLMCGLISVKDMTGNSRKVLPALVRSAGRLREPAAPKIGYRLFDFFNRVHHEGTVLHYRFTQRAASQQQET